MKKLKLIAFTGLLFAGVFSGSVLVKAEDKITVNIGDQPPVFPVKIAEANGYFAEELGDNAEVNVIQFSSGPEIVEGYAAGEVDFSISGDSPIIQGIANGVDIRIIAAPAASDKGSGLVATESSGIEKLEDIKGKKIGVTLGSTYHQLLLIYLESLGLTADDVQIVNVPTAEAITALNSNNIDAAILNAQNISIAESEGAAKLIETSEGYKYGIVAVSARKSFADENPEITTGFLKALQRATEFIAENPEESVKIMSDLTDISETDLSATLSTQDYVFDFDDIKVNSVQQSVDFAYEADLITKELDINDVVDTGYLKNAGIID